MYQGNCSIKILFGYYNVLRIKRCVSRLTDNPRICRIPGYFTLISISHGTPWTRLTFDPSVVKRTIVIFQVYEPTTSDASEFPNYFDTPIMARYFKIELEMYGSGGSLPLTGICLGFELIGCSHSGKFGLLLFVCLLLLLFCCLLLLVFFISRNHYACALT